MNPMNIVTTLFDPRYRKYAVAAIGAAALVASQLAPVLPDDWKPWALVVIAVAEALGVRQMRNAPALPR